jgi:SAM-dependent methyltransferase
MPASAPERVRSRFRAKARAFDDLYEDERPRVRLLRPGLLRRRQLAVDTVGSYEHPRVLDVGCGSGRIAEFILEGGAGSYVGVDFSEPMLELARARLERFEDRVELIEGDFLQTPVRGPFHVILALGLFDYVAEPEQFTNRMFELCAPGGCVLGSFPAWSFVKGPIRKVRYEWIGNCPIFNYTPHGVQTLFGESGFQSVEIPSRGQNGFLAIAARRPPAVGGPPGRRE